MKALLLDLDGTIRRPTSGKFIEDPNDQEPIEGSIKTMKIYHREGWIMIGITNQGGVAAGHKSLKSAIEEQRRTLEIFPLLSYIYFCPDFEGNLCYGISRKNIDLIHEIRKEFLGQFRKPNCGMISAALKCFKNPSKALMVGDQLEDEEAAAFAGIRFLSADIWRFPPIDREF
ncbi:MAG: HAD-IIIA family hydrolase [Microcystis sp. M54BS1]|uniref:HAD-IIIA family hydrolase n=1 Tax=unclassified Microcystis TaxID=2643300 RepID=UPI00257F403E|nr:MULTISPECIES: HAD-IIIA family hydrolase [unclassified Microcystis]MCA2537956.1 HAD-IIIA family hydrolase [Microcystis sp. M54BS1]MCA2598035.1 HAD-IIIA family hydrolase [Microcystis sp. M38BS1]MCA2612920.1 HAD-IIIA family hydrolase [Microcystis sp. M27BS1]MCA2506831.1 HAD-IIIA family hydrolase [Microcystis sp. M62BS1]MCA2509426.1 HAD-IIIA family hydrolase [Microcystis sp. M60BS1]